MCSLIIIPAYNESATIERVVREAIEMTGWPVLVIDDGSQDQTAFYARAAGACVLPLVVNIGAWGATQAGIRYALHMGVHQVVTMDADGQHLAQCIRLLIAALNQDADVAIGAHVERASPARLFAWRFFRKLTGLGIEDLTSGFRAYNQAALRILASQDATLLDYQDIGVLLLLREAKLRVREVDVPMLPRAVGASRIFRSWPVVLRYLIITLVLCLSKLRS